MAFSGVDEYIRISHCLTPLHFVPYGAEVHGGISSPFIDANYYDLGVAATILHPVLRSGSHMLRFFKKNMFSTNNAQK